MWRITEYLNVLILIHSCLTKVVLHTLGFRNVSTGCRTPTALVLLFEKATLNLLAPQQSLQAFKMMKQHRMARMVSLKLAPGNIHLLNNSFCLKRQVWHEVFHFRDIHLLLWFGNCLTYNIFVEKIYTRWWSGQLWYLYTRRTAATSSKLSFKLI